MDVAALFISIVAALAGGAAAIAAWASRADSLHSAERAERAQEAALKSWEDAASALLEANQLSSAQYSESVERERRQRRAAVAEPIRHSFSTLVLKRAAGVEPTASENEERRELVIRVGSTGEPGGMLLVTTLQALADGVQLGDGRGGVVAAGKMTTHIANWISDPEAFRTADGVAVDAETLSKQLLELADDFDVLAGRINEAKEQAKTDE